MSTAKKENIYNGIKSAYLSSDFGEGFATRLFSEIEGAVGRYTRGSRVGKLRGIIKWAKVQKGDGGYLYGNRNGVGMVFGQKRNFDLGISGNGVVRPGMLFAWVEDYEGNTLAAKAYQGFSLASNDADMCDQTEFVRSRETV